MDSKSLFWLYAFHIPQVFLDNRFSQTLRMRQNGFEGLQIIVS